MLSSVTSSAEQVTGSVSDCAAAAGGPLSDCADAAIGKAAANRKPSRHAAGKESRTERISDSGGPDRSWNHHCHIRPRETSNAAGPGRSPEIASRTSRQARAKLDILRPDQS
jgi:hypothetical protein